MSSVIRATLEETAKLSVTKVIIKAEAVTGKIEIVMVVAEEIVDEMNVMKLMKKLELIEFSNSFVF